MELREAIEKEGYTVKDVYLVFCEMMDDIDESKNRLNERNKKIYNDKKIDKLDNKVLEEKWQLCKRQINRIVEKQDQKFNKVL